MDPTFLAAAGLVVAGLGLAWVGALRTRTDGPDAADYLRSLDEVADEDLDDYQQHLREPLAARLLRPLGASIGRSVGSITPRAHLDRLHAQILQGGLAGTIRAEELAAVQAVLTGVGVVAGLLLTALLRPSPAIASVLLLGLPFFGFFGPQAWLTRHVDERKASIRNDLPDALDLLAIAVEAGTGFEGAMAVVCANFESPLGEELQRLLKEMELGLSRREALQNLKRRTEVPELSQFVLALVQADALGMPVGRVLKTQAVEMRNKRRAWAREKAAKLPVKIMIPLVLFIFPAILVVTIGPAGSSLVGNL